MTSFTRIESQRLTFAIESRLFSLILWHETRDDPRFAFDDGQPDRDLHSFVVFLACLFQPIASTGLVVLIAD